MAVYSEKWQGHKRRWEGRWRTTNKSRRVHGFGCYPRLFSLMVACRGLTGDLNCANIVQYFTSRVANHTCFTCQIILQYLAYNCINILPASSRHRLCRIIIIIIIKMNSEHSVSSQQCLSAWEQPLIGLTANNKYFMLLDDRQLQLTYWEQEKEGYDGVTGVLVEGNG